MIKFKGSWFIAALALVPFSLNAEVKKPSDAAAVPESIRTILNREYPGWTLAPVTPQIHMTYKQHKVTHSPSVAQGDFAHNGKRDYAVQIVLKTMGQEEQIIIVFMALGDGFEEIILQSMGIDPTSSLWVTRATRDDTGANPDNAVPRDVLMVLGGVTGDTTYSYYDGAFHEIPAPDDPEHPDPMIPRVPPSSEQAPDQVEP